MSRRTSSRRRTRRRRKPSLGAILRRPAVQLGILAVAALAFVLIALTGNRSGASALPPEISVDQAYEKYQAGAFFLDVRTVEEWNEYHIPNATLIPLDELPNRLDEVPRDREIVVVCRSGNRSQVGRDILLDAGFPRVTSMAGGVKTWRSAGYPVVSGP